MSADSPAGAHDFLSGGGEMGKLIREKDWSKTPLGPFRSWPQSLRTSLSTALDCAFPIIIWWGPDLLILYNDEYRPMLGPAKHPSALGERGAKVWAEIWDVIGPMLSRVMQHGEATRSRDLLLHIDRGYPEEAYFSFSYSPIRNEDGEVCGIFCPVIETTEKVIGERRLRTLRDLAAGCKGAESEQAVYESASKVLADNARDVPFTMIYRVDERQSVAHLDTTAGIEPGADAAPRKIPLSGHTAGIWSLSAVAQSCTPVVSADLSSQFDSLPTGAWQVPAHSAMVLPIVLPGQERPRAIMIAAVSPMRALDEDYRTFFGLIATQIASGLADAEALEEERKRAEALAELDRAKTAFFSNVSHEFRTPLTLMLGPVEDALADPATPSEVRQRLNVSHRNSLRLLKLVNSLLDFSRIEAGRIQAAYQPTDLGALTAELASNFRSACEKAGLKLIVNCDMPTESVYVDREMWEKIVLNLISNAFKYTLAGEIEVSLRKAPACVLPRDAAEERGVGGIELSVRDTGIGISEYELPNVFQRFYRVEGARGRTHEGTGIGLSLVQELVKLHGGTISVDSVYGEGSTFTVRIPLGSKHLPADRIRATAVRTLASTRIAAGAYIEEALRWLPGEAEPTAEEILSDSATTDPSTVSTQGARVIVADDNADMRDYIRNLLGEHYRVESAADGETALTAARREKPDLILADVMMPLLDGFGLLRAIREDEILKSIPVIMLSARAGEEAKLEGLSAGADDYLVKPFTAKELLARVEAHLKLQLVRREAEKALRESEERYRRLIGLLPVAVYTCEAPSGVITFYNERAAELWGRTPKIGEPNERFCGSFKLFRPAGTLLPHEEAPMAVAVREGRRFRNQEVVIERPDGTRITVLVNIDPLHDENGNLAGAINVFHDTTALKEAERERARLLARERQARDEAETLNEVAQTLAGELDLEKIVQKATDAATQLTGAQFGAFFYNVIDQQDESYVLFTLSGAPREAFEKFGMPRNTPLFAHTFTGKGIVRSDDITKHERYGKNPPHQGMPKGHLPVRSYLAAPVISRSGQVLGGLFFGHSETGVFSERAERLASGIAAQAAIAIDNARLFAEAQQEIHERKVAEEAKAKLAAIVESSHDAIVSKDLNGVIASWNKGAERIFGYTAEEAIGRPIAMLIPPERLDEEPDILARIRRGERIEHYETVRHRKDGTLLDVSLSVSPIVDAHGRIIGASKIARDITERKRAEDKLRESEARFRLMADSSPVMIWMTDADGNPAFLNKAYREYFGIGEDRLAQFNWARVVHPEDRDHYVEGFRRALRESGVFHERVRLRRADGQWRWFESRGNPLLDHAGNVMGFIGSSPDITDIYESQQALKELGQRKDEFLANMSHEIRSPLTGIMGYADLLLSKLKDPEDLECLSTIKESGDYLLEIVNDILDLSKIEAGKLVLYIEPVSVHAVLAEIQGLMSVRARQKGLPLVLRYDGVLPQTMLTDRTRLRQIVVNLVSNAIKFTERGKVEIVARFSEPVLEVEVIDSGIGIAPEHQKVLFQPFSQADTTSTRRYGGTGLGLTITKRLVEMLGGGISFESERGRGSVFRVQIPTKTAAATDVHQRRARAAQREQAQGGLLRDRRVLVVDDREEICYLVTRYIKDAGGSADKAVDGEAAIQAVESAPADEPFDAVILDIHMPGMDGYEVARTLRDKGYRTPIIALTAGAMVGDREKCLQAGCDDYLTKPIDRQKLVQLVSELAQRVPAEKGPCGASLRVLVVDDNHNACKLLISFLDKRGHEVRAAQDGASALALARIFRPEVILLDIRLTDMTGYELMRRLKELDVTKGARFIGVSGYYDERQELSGFDDFLEKPLDMSLLDQLVRSARAD